MSPKLYGKIFQLSKELESGSILEIGTAGGGSIISAALGLKAAGRGLKAISIDKFEGGSWGTGSDVESNIKKVNDRLQVFGVAEHASILKEKLGGAQHIYDHLKGISLLIIDADGRIQRDLMSLSKSCANEALILIDDCEKCVRVNADRNGNWTVCWKKYKTWVMVKHLLESGVLAEEEILDGAFLGKFYPDKMDSKLFNELDTIYKNIEDVDVSLDEIRINLNTHDQFGEDCRLLEA